MRARESGSEGTLSQVEVLLLVVGLMLAAVLLVGVGDRLRLPGVDPEAADRVLRRLDLSTVLLD